MCDWFSPSVGSGALGGGCVASPACAVVLVVVGPADEARLGGVEVVLVFVGAAGVGADPEVDDLVLGRGC